MYDSWLIRVLVVLVLCIVTAIMVDRNRKAELRRQERIRLAEELFDQDLEEMRTEAQRCRERQRHLRDRVREQEIVRRSSRMYTLEEMVDMEINNACCFPHLDRSGIGVDVSIRRPRVEKGVPYVGQRRTR